jgi:hypothetical protein
MTALAWITAAWIAGTPAAFYMTRGRIPSRLRTAAIWPIAGMIVLALWALGPDKEDRE